MKVVFDTSVLVPAMVKVHLMHSRAWIWLERAKSRELEFVVAAPTLAELYAVLTTLPVRPRITPDVALKLIADNVQAEAQILPLQPSDYAAILHLMAEQGIAERCTMPWSHGSQNCPAPTFC